MFRKFLKDYFTFTRSERNGLLVLILIILILIIVRLIIPHIRQNTTYDFSQFQDEIDEFEKSVSESDENPPLFLFDPNTATREQLLNLGLEPKVVKNLLKYRDRGGIFRVREDVKKVYGLDSIDYRKIEPYIQIAAPKGTNKGKSLDIKDLSGDIKGQYGDSVKIYPDAEDGRTGAIIPIPINRSDSAELISIYGIGPILSSRIVKYRSLLGGYVNKEQLREVYGMTDENFEKICNAIYIDTAGVIPVNINTADFYILNRHPYLSDYHARALIAFREFNGSFNNISEVEYNHLVPPDVFKKIKPYLTVE